MPSLTVGLRPPTAYDFEYHVGMERGSLNAIVQAECSTLLSDALQAQHATGLFKFNTGTTTGPVLRELNAQAGEFLSRGTIVDSNRWGGKLSGFGTRSWQFSTASNNIGAMTRYTRVDGETGGAVYRMRGNGKMVDGMVFSGRQYVHDPTGEGPDGPQSTPTGTRVGIGIEIEGQNASANGGPPAGLHVISNSAVWSCDVAIFQRDGYYDDNNVFHSLGTGANGDNISVINFVSHDCDTVFRSDNPQAVVWDFDRLYIIYWGGEGARPVTVFDCISCSDITARVISINNPSAVVVQVTNNLAQHVVCEHVRWDHGYVPKLYTLFKFAGTVFPDMSSYRFSTEITGSVPARTNYIFGTVDVSGTAVTGDGTLWNSTTLTAGMQIGFGSTDPASISTWYTIGTINSDTSITLTGSAGTVAPGSAYVILWPDPYPIKKLIDIPQASQPDYRFPVDNIRLKIWRLPKEGFIDIGGGWWKPGPDYTCDLKSRWRMNDASGTSVADVWNGKTGTLGGTVPTWVAKDLRSPNYGAKLVSALSFAHNSGAVIIPDDASLRMTTGGTLSFWFLARSFANGVLVSKFGTNPSGVRIEASGTHLFVSGDGATSSTSPTSH
jgi:hypothetical protein